MRTLRPDRLEARRWAALARHTASRDAQVSRLKELKTLAAKTKGKAYDAPIASSEATLKAIQLSVDNTEANLKASAPHRKPRGSVRSVGIGG